MYLTFKPATINRPIPALCLTLSLLGSSLTNAAFILEIDNDLNAGNGRTTIIDGDTDGLITYTGGYGDFSVVAATGLTSPTVTDPVSLYLNSIQVTNSANSSGGTLYVWLTNTDFNNTASGLIADFGGTTQGPADFHFLYDTLNNEFGGGIFASGNNATSSTGGTSFSSSLASPITPTPPYSLTIFAEITHTAAGQVSSFDASITTVPVPATAWLFGSALFGISTIIKRQK